MPREAVALVKPVTSAPRPSMGPTLGEGPGEREGVARDHASKVYE